MASIQWSKYTKKPKPLSLADQALKVLPEGEYLCKESSLLSSAASALVFRQKHKIRKLAKQHKNTLWKLRKAMAGIKRAVRLEKQLKEQPQLPKLKQLMAAAVDVGITDMTLDCRCGWLIIHGKYNGTGLKGHIWSDLRGPVLDFNYIGYRMPVGAKGDSKPLLRIKAFSKIYIENRLLDMVLEGEPKPTFNPF